MRKILMFALFLLLCKSKLLILANFNYIYIYICQQMTHHCKNEAHLCVLRKAEKFKIVADLVELLVKLCIKFTPKEIVTYLYKIIGYFTKCTQRFTMDELRWEICNLSENRTEDFSKRKDVANQMLFTNQIEKYISQNQQILKMFQKFSCQVDLMNQPKYEDQGEYILINNLSRKKLTEEILFEKRKIQRLEQKKRKTFEQLIQTGNHCSQRQKQIITINDQFYYQSSQFQRLKSLTTQIDNRNASLSREVKNLTSNLEVEKRINSTLVQACLEKKSQLQTCEMIQIVIDQRAKEYGLKKQSLNIR